MSSIDNRIVILSFDNKDFEKNVQTSMNTLDKLKNNLDLSQSSKGLTALAASAKSFDLGPMGRAIESIRERFSNLGIVGMTVLQNLTNTAVDFGKKLVSAAIGPLTSGGWKRALDIEQATFQMEGLLLKTEGGAQKIDAIMTQVQESVRGTAFGANEAARVASQLVATGVEDAQQMRKYLDGVAGAAAMTGGAYDEIGHIFTTVAGQGKLMGEQLNQFAYRGLNVAATLSKQMGITEAEFREMVHDGEITFDMFAKGLAEAFGDQAVKANETFTGSLANMRAALARIGQDVATPALTYLRDLFNSLRLLIDQVHERLKPFIETLNTKLTNAAKKATSFVDSLTEALGGVSARMKKEMGDTADTVEESAESITKSSEEIEEAARRVLSGEFGDGDERRAQLEALGYSYEEVQNKVNELLDCDYRYEVQTKSTTEALKEAAKETENYTVKSKTLSQALGSEIFSNFLTSIWNIKKALEQFGTAIKKSFLSVFNDRALERILIGVRNISDAFKAFTQSILLNKDEQTGLQTVLEGVFIVVRKGIEIILKGVEYFIRFSTAVNNVVTKILGFIGAFRDVNSELDRTSRKVRFLEALGGVFTKIGEAVQGFKDKLIEVLGRVKNTGGFMKLMETLKELWGILKDLGGKIIDSVIEKMEKFAGKKLDFSWLDGLVPLLGKAAGKLADFIKWIIDGIPKIQTFFASLKDGTNDSIFGKIVSFFINAKDAVADFFKSLVGGAGEGGEKLDLFSSIKKVFEDALTNVGDFFRGLSTTGFIEGLKTFIGNIVTAASSLDTQTVIDFLKDVGKVIAEIVAFVTVVKFLKSASNFFNGIGNFFGGITKSINGFVNIEKTKILLIAIGEIIAALWVISKIPTEDLKKSVIALGVILGGAIAALEIVNALPFDDAKMKTFAVAMAGLGVGVLALSGAAKILASFSWPEFLSAAGKLGILVGLLVAASRIAGDVKAAAAFMGLAVAVNLLVPALAILGHFKWETIIKGATAIGVVALELGLASRLAGEVKAAAAFMGLAIAVDLLVPALAILGKMKWETIKQGAIALGIIVTELAIACRIASSENSGKGALAMLAMVVPIAAVIAGIKILGDMPRDQLLQGAIALGAIIAAIGGSLALASKTSASAGSLVAMAGILAIAIGGLYILKDTPWQTLLAGGLALSMVMLAIGEAMNSAENVKPNVAGFAAMLIPFAAAVVGLYILRDAPWETLLAGGAALSIVMLAMAEALKIASDAEPLGAIALDVVSLAVIPLCYGLAQIAGFEWQNILGAAVGLSAVIIAIAAAMRLMAGMNPVVAAVTSVGLGAAIDIIMGFIVGFTDILGQIDEWRNGGFLESVQKGKEILETVGEAIGGFIGKIGEGITNSLPAMGENLSAFAENMKGFFEAVREYGTDAGTLVAELAASFAVITGTEFLDGIFSLLNGGESALTQFGEELAGFGEPFKTFAESVKGISIEEVAAAAAAMKEVAVAAGEIPNEGGMLAELIGDNTLSQFGPELSAFGPSLKNFWLNCKSIKEGDLTGAASALTEVATAADEIPNEGGFLSKITGDNTLSQFGPQLADFGPSLKSFWLNCKSINEGDLTGASKALTDICTAANDIPNEGGFLATIIGDNTLSQFGPELSAFGPHLSQFVDSVSGISGSESAVTAAATALKEIVSAAAEIPNQGLSIASIVVGDNTLSKFGEELEKFGPHMAAFADSVAGISITKMLAVASTMPNIVQMAVDAKDVNKNDFSNFGGGLEEFGGKLKAYYDSISGVSTSKIQQVIQTVYRLIEVGNTMASVNTGAMSDFGSALENVGQTGVDLFISAFENSYDDVTNVVNDFVQAAQDGANSFISAFQNSASEAYAAVSYLVSYAAMGATGSNMDFYYAGQNAGYGLINGFNSVASYAYSVAYTVASNMAATIRNALRIHSPSQVMYGIGDYAGQGLVLGLKSKLSDVNSTSRDMANVIIGSVATPISNLQNVIDENLDFEPVITPVLDLTNISNGAGALSNMFDVGTARMSFASRFDVDSIDPIMSLAEKMAENYSGSESVINAIDEIRSEVANLGVAITGMKIWLDGQTVVGELVDPIDQALGERMGMRERGLY